MGRSKDMWLADYEAIPDNYTKDVIEHGEDYARDMATRALKSLGFDPAEINDHLSMLTE